MSYRQSSYEPLATTVQGPPLKPLNWVQWCGVGMIGLAIAFALYYLGGQIGLVARTKYSTVPMAPLMLLGSLLINSRRQQIPPEEQAAYRRKIWRQLLIVLAIATLAAIAGAAFVILSKGA